MNTKWRWCACVVVVCACGCARLPWTWAPPGGDAADPPPTPPLVGETAKPDWRWEDVRWIHHADVSRYTEVMIIRGAKIAKNWHVTWSGDTHPRSWPELCDGCNGAVGWVCRRRGRLYGVGANELLRPGMQYQTGDTFKSRRGQRFRDPDTGEEWRPMAGDEYWIFVVSARGGFTGREPRERSNVVRCERL